MKMLFQLSFFIFLSHIIMTDNDESQKKIIPISFNNDLEILSNQYCNEGFLEGTLIQTINGCIPVEQVQTDDILIGVHGTQEILSIKKTKTEQYVQLFIGDEIIYANMHQQFYLANKTWISACYLDAGTLLFNGQCIIKSEIINNVSTCYNFSTQEQSYFIYPNIYVHNFDLVVLSSTGTFILGAIEISNPVTILLGIIIPLSLYAIQNFESHIAPDYKIKDDSDFSKDSYLQNNKVIQKTREYYDSKRHALQNLYEDLIKIKNDLSFFIKPSDKNNFSFSFNFLPTIQLTNYTLINLPSLSQELALSNIDKQKLIKIRNDELEKLQQNIFDIHLCLAFHINELIERRNQTNEQLHDVSKKVNQWVHSWNNNLYNIPNDVALNHYEFHFTLKETLDNLEIKTNEIKYILSYYERLKNNFFVHKTTNIANIIAQQSKINTDILESIALNRNIWWSNMCITENLLTDRNLLSIQLVNCYTNKAKEFIAEQEKNNFIVAQKKKDSMLDIIKKE